MKSILTLFSLLFLAHSALLAAELKGTVRDAETGESLPGANVYIEGVERGATTDLDGQFAIANVGAGSHTLVVSFIGYKDHRSPVVVGADAAELFVELMPEVFRGKEIIIVADRAKMRETPVAFSDVPKADMQRKLGSRDLPLILNDTPGVYATAQGGGAGDARINVRGFDQRNVAVMINGVPVNDMENGWVYWSNWDGLSDVTSSIQVQRGLGASNLAIASVGGTMNIITDIASQRRGFKFKQEAGNNAFYKTTLNFSSGLINKKTAFTLGMTRKSSEGLPAQAWSSAWAYFGALSFLASDAHKIDLFVTGAPQRHGHRLYKQSIATFDADYARSLDIDVADAKNYGVDYNPNWGRSPFSSYQEYYNGSVHDARDSKNHHGARKFLPQTPSQFELVLDPQHAIHFVQCILFLAWERRRHRAFGLQSGDARRRHHQLAARCRRVEYPSRFRVGGCWRSRCRRNRGSNHYPQLGQSALLVWIFGYGRIPHERHLQADLWHGFALLQRGTLARSAQFARSRLLRLCLGQQCHDLGQATRR